jgi:hypothetical protein
MAIASISEFLVNAPSFILFEDYPFDFARDIINKTEKIKLWLFDYE